MYLGHIVAGFMLRQMEFDADMYETRVAGSQAFAATCRKLRLIGVSYQGAQRDLGGFYREGRLGDNMPLMIQANLKQLPKKVYKLVDEAIAKSETGMFDDHPADKDRIAAAQAANAIGAFQSDLPASVLFANVEAAAKNVTWDFYCASFGRTIDPNSLHPTSSLLARQDQELSAVKSRDRFFAGAFSVLRPLRLPPARFEKTEHPAVWQQELAQARAAMEANAAAYAELLDPYDKADTRLIQARQARSVLSAGVRLQAAHFEQPVHSASEAHQQRERAEVELSRMGNRMEAFEVAAGNRLMAAISLLFDPATAARVPHAAELQREVKRLLPIVSTVATNHGSLFELRNNNATLPRFWATWATTRRTMC
jgi:hypothetical protein